MHEQNEDRKDQLQMKQLKNQTFQNWAKTFSCKPALVLMAQTEADVVQAIAMAHKHNLKLRVVGTGHSPSDISCTTGILLNIDALATVSKVDMEALQITVGAGIKLHQLNDLLDRLGLALLNLGSISEQSIAGAISTGTHGTGIKFGILASMVLELRLVIANGEILTLSRESSPDLFLAALCSLGCLGVITRVKLQVVSAYQIKSIQKPIQFKSMINDFGAHVQSADHVRFWWFPHSDNCIVWKGTRTSELPQTTQSDWLKNTLFGVHGYEASLYASTWFPSLVPTINRQIFNLLFSAPVSAIGKSFNVFNFDCLFSQYVTEWAIEWTKAPEALVKLKAFLEEHPKIVAHSPIEIRFVKADDIPMSMSYGHDTCFIGIIMYRPYGMEVDKAAYWKGYESIMMSLGGRPHWAKEHHLTAKDLRERYPQFDSFCAIRSRLDPTDIFTNQYIDRHILESPTMAAKL
ncbi:D-arabinono-1,4-lactone oxidase [Batrachochytrium dendrobatidis]|nr:D-arabinono-1,4-lactone oxidase [Batrachochytrium dendrobatidis]